MAVFLLLYGYSPLQLLYFVVQTNDMKLNLTKPLVVFDLETTGLDLVNDRIIQISFIKVLPDGKEERENIFINPEKPIPTEVTQLTGISDKDVTDAPTFRQKAKELADRFTGCDFAGFNSNRFDVPMLAEEFLRAGVDFDFSKSRLIDAQNIYHKMERRNLAAAYKFYCGRKMEEDFEAHKADQDTEATWRVLQGELDMYSPDRQEEADRVLANDMDELAEFSRMNDFVDFAGRMVWKEMTDKDGNTLLDAAGSHVATRCSTSGNTEAGTWQKYCTEIQVITVGCWQATSPITRNRF